jgi:hypothetical protein
MGLTVDGYTFEGPYSSLGNLQNKPGIYLIVCHRTSGVTPLGCGQSDNVKNSVGNHTAKESWRLHCTGAVKFAVIYTPDMEPSQRDAIEHEIRSRHNFPCDER